MVSHQVFGQHVLQARDGCRTAVPLSLGSIAENSETGRAMEQPAAMVSELLTTNDVSVLSTSEASELRKLILITKSEPCVQRFRWSMVPLCILCNVQTLQTPLQAARPKIMLNIPPTFVVWDRERCSANERRTTPDESEDGEPLHNKTTIARDTPAQEGIVEHTQNFRRPNLAVKSIGSC